MIDLSFLGDRVSDDPLERWLYAQDMAVVPPLLIRPFFQTLPDAVARPRTTDEVAQVLRAAALGRMPVIPRAAATTSYFQAVPVHGGVVLDLNDLRGLLSLDKAAGTATVLPGTRWRDLDDELRTHGFATCSHPTSAVAATVGGWLSTGGRGVGSLRYGPLGTLVKRATAVLPAGQASALTPESNPPLAWFAGAEGTLGVLTEITLQVRPRPTVEAHHLLACDDPAQLQSTAFALAAADLPPYAILFTDAPYSAMLAQAGFGMVAGGVGGLGRPAADSLLLVSYQGTVAEVAQGQAQLAALAVRELGEAAALHEWQERLYHLRVKRAGPSLLAAEMTLPLDRLASYLGAVAQLARSARTSIGTYGVVVSRQEALVTSVYPADARQQYRYLLALGLTRCLQDRGSRAGGRPYGVGLWNAPYLPRLFSRPQLAALRARKRQLDPLNLLNPGKLYAAPFPLWPRLFGLASGALFAAYALSGGARR